MPLLSKHFDAYLFNPPSAARVEMQIRWKDYYKESRLQQLLLLSLPVFFQSIWGKENTLRIIYLKSLKY